MMPYTYPTDGADAIAFRREQAANCTHRDEITKLRQSIEALRRDLYALEATCSYQCSPFVPEVYAEPSLWDDDYFSAVER